MRTLAIAALATVAGSANADILISEILGSTAGSDLEFIELVNTGAAAVDISLWSVELWDSDFGAQFGQLDGSSPFIVPNGTILAPGAVFTFSNMLADTGYGITGDAALNGSVENSSYTAVLADFGLALVDAVFVTDGSDPGDAANRGGVPVSALTVGPDGTFLPAGFARTDVSGGFVFLEFGNDNRGSFSLTSGTPGVNQIPAPASVALLGLGGLAAIRRRR